MEYSNHTHIRACILQSNNQTKNILIYVNDKPSGALNWAPQKKEKKKLVMIFGVMRYLVLNRS